MKVHSPILRPASRPTPPPPDKGEKVEEGLTDLFHATRGLEKLRQEKLEHTEEEYRQLRNQQVRLCLRLALDLGGIFDPTPICDGLSAALALYDTQFTEAALSVVSMVPYLGDAVAKPIKAGTFAVRLARTVKKARALKKTLKSGDGRAE